jgi:hypothetical protein
MLKQIQAYGTVKDQRTGANVATIQGGAAIQLQSLDGTTWFMDTNAMIAHSNRTTEIAHLTEQQKGWLDLIELPSGYDLRSAIRQSGGGR